MLLMRLFVSFVSFADDVSSIAIGNTIKEVEDKCQESIHLLQEWCKRNGMKLNEVKTKVINFSSGEKGNITVFVNNHKVEVSKVIKYLGVLVDENLEFDAQVQSAVGKARAAQNKVNILLRGRRGIPLDISINLYKALVRPHWENAIASWSVLKDCHILELEKVQASSLKFLLGVFKSSSSSAVEVIANIAPVRFRINEICSREWIRIMALSETHPLRKMLESEDAFYDGSSKGSPLGHMKYITKDLQGFLKENNLLVEVQAKLSPEVVVQQVQMECEQIFSVAVGNSNNRTAVQAETARGIFNAFYEGLPSDSLIAFTDGSVLGSACVGKGGYGVVIHGKDEEPQVSSGFVGRMTDNVTCEVQAIVEALNLIVVRTQTDRCFNAAYVFTDCQSAIDIFTKQGKAHEKLEVFRVVWKSLRILKDRNIDLKLIWIPGHADILGNELADRAAKNGALIHADIVPERISAHVLFGWVKDKVLKRWGEMWSNCTSGVWTKDFLREVGRKLVFPRDRSSGMTYARALLNNAAVADNMFRMGLVDSPDCRCGLARETVEHVLMDCELEADARGRLLMEVGNVWMNNKKHGGLKFSLDTILNPFANPKINQSDSVKILECVFSFFRNLSKKL